MIDKEKVRKLLEDWQPGEDVDTDSLLEGALYYFVDGALPPSELRDCPICGGDASRCDS